MNDGLLTKEYSGLYEYPPIVLDWWCKEPNYLIEYDESVEDKSYCAIYFCSNDIWFPHTEEMFKKRIVDSNFFEWYKCRVKRAYKHIFIRDVFKQWYLAGINSNINSQEKLYDWLYSETYGFKSITIGSSAGGYAATFFGSRLKSEMVICFNGQFSLRDVSLQCSHKCNPLVYSMVKKGGYDADVMKWFNEKTLVFYILSNKSTIDVKQHKYVEGVSSVRVVHFKSKRHGIPFLKVALPGFINFDVGQLEALSKKKHSPIWFTVSMVGLFKTIKGFVKQVVSAYKKRF